MSGDIMGVTMTRQMTNKGSEHTKADITFPSAESDKLILVASLKRSP